MTSLSTETGAPAAAARCLAEVERDVGDAEVDRIPDPAGGGFDDPGYTDADRGKAVDADSGPITEPGEGVEGRCEQAVVSPGREQDGGPFPAVAVDGDAVGLGSADVETGDQIARAGHVPTPASSPATARPLARDAP